jgi:hypothetical protein
METGPDEYRQQIEDWMETVCEMTFDDSLPSDRKKPTPEARRPPFAAPLYETSSMASFHQGATPYRTELHWW